jgi:SAM-dependent methyltransferase
MILGDLLREYEPLADLYDLEYDHDYDLPFWLALAEREGGPVVEWGAGTGRLAAPLADVGLDVTAVEVSQNMLEKGREKGGTVEWIRGDMRHVKLGGRYVLAVCAFNSFLCLLSVNDALVFLRNAREHLKPDGLLGIEVSAFTPEELCEGAEGPVLRHDFTREREQETPKRTLERFSVSRYDAASQLLRMRLFYELYGSVCREHTGAWSRWTYLGSNGAATLRHRAGVLPGRRRGHAFRPGGRATDAVPGDGQ